MTEKQTGRINAQLLTKCINHWADSANFKGVTFNKLCSGLAVKCFEMPNASYTNRYIQFLLAADSVVPRNFPGFLLYWIILICITFKTPSP
jgi:hypothetical protein